MKPFLVITLALTTTLSANPNFLVPVIYGGKEAKQEEVSHVAFIDMFKKVGQSWYRRICGGSIINRRTILTAAHCVVGVDKEMAYIRVGSLQWDDGGTLLRVGKIVIHPNYDEGTKRYDIALLHIYQNGIPVNGNTIKPVSLPTSEPTPGTEVLVAGWGIRESEPSLPHNLYSVNVNIVSRDTCRDNYISTRFTIHDDMICAGVDGGGKDSCQGDSGGPLTKDGVQYGVVSFGHDCALPGYPGVYSSVYHLKDWIKANRLQSGGTMYWYNRTTLYMDLTNMHDK